MPKTNNDIRIKTIQWELDAADAATAHHWQDVISVFSREKMSLSVEEMLAPYNDNDQVLRVEKLELDLSFIHNEEQLEEQFMRRFREKLNTVIAEKAAVSGRKSESGITRTQLSLWQQLEYYLDHGHLSWSTNANDFSDPGKLYLLLNERPAAQLCTWLRKIASVPATLMRFVEFFTTVQLGSLLEKVFPGTTIPADANAFMDSFTQKAAIKIPDVMKFYSLYHQVFARSFTKPEELAVYWWRELKEKSIITREEIEKAEAFMLAYCSGRKEQFPAGEPVYFSRIIRHLSRDQKQVAPVNETGAGETLMNTPVPEIKMETGDKKFFIENAGIVLLYPYLKQLFRENGLLTPEYDFSSTKDQLEACYLLQFIASGNKELKEYELVLNKVLCGYPDEAPVTRSWDGGKASAEKADEFLREVTGNWSKIANTSPAGFRNSFLLRQGKLIEEDMNWLLWVERKGWDVLLDSLPYPLSIIRLPWMIKPLYVQW